MTAKSNYYKRQVILPELGFAGQEKLTKAKVLVIGAGGLGAPLLTYLCVAGIGSITIYDHDTIEESNLNRQVLFDPNDIGKNKAQVTATKLSIKNPLISIDAITRPFNENVDISSFDIVIDCTDNFTTKFLAHDLSFKYNKKFCVASIHKFEGQIQFFDFEKKDKTSPCMRCLWAEKPSDTCVQNCEEAGVIGAVAGVLGTMQAMEVIKSITKLDHLKNNENLLVNLLDFSSFKIKLAKDEQCPLCGENKQKTIDSDESLIIDFKQIAEGSYTIVNLYNEYSAPKGSIDSTLTNIIEDLKHIEKSQKIAVICKRGITSLKATKTLINHGYQDVYSIRGGAISQTKI